MGSFVAGLDATVINVALPGFEQTSIGACSCDITSVRPSAWLYLGLVGALVRQLPS